MVIATQYDDELDTDQQEEGEAESEPLSGSKVSTTASSKSAITDELASEIFDKLTKMQGKKTYYAKKNWTDDESKLL